MLEEKTSIITKLNEAERMKIDYFSQNEQQK